MAILGIYYIAPLTSLLQVLKERDSSSIYWPLSLMNLANALLWMVYGMVSVCASIWGELRAGLLLATVAAAAAEPLLVGFGKADCSSTHKHSLVVCVCVSLQPVCYLSFCSGTQGLVLHRHAKCYGRGIQHRLPLPVRGAAST